MDELLDLLTGFLPVEAIVSIFAGLAVLAGGILILLRYVVRFTALPGPEIVIGLGLIAIGILAFLFRSVAGEALEIILG